MDNYSAYEDELNTHYQIVNVTKGGIDFLLTSLRYGCTLSNLVAKYIPIESGRIETFIHRSIEKNKAFQFENGYITLPLPESLNSIPNDGCRFAIEPVDNFFVVPTIQEFLIKNRQNICILEDIDGTPDSLWLTESKHPPLFTFYDTEVYFYIDEKKPTVATIRETFSLASAPWSTKAFLTSIPESIASLRITQKVDLQSLQIIAKNTKKIVISAYDGEGYLIWHHP